MLASTSNRPRNSTGFALLAAFLLVFVFLSAGCQNPRMRGMSAEDMVPTRLVLSPGDSIEIAFPGAPNLDTKVRIGPEGNITMPLVGQVQAAGLTADELQLELLRLFESELQDKEVIVTITESGNIVYVMGAVLRPGPLSMTRPVTLVEAIMLAGGFTPTANQKEIKVIRYVGDHNVTYSIDLSPLLSGGPVSPFYLQPRDIVHVSEKMQWF